MATRSSKKSKIGMSRRRGRVRIVSPVQAAGLLDWNGTARYTLEITLPVSAMHSNHRWRHAYPGLPYNVRVGAVGGVFPYLYELINAPSGMTIGPFTGEITWPNPQSNAANIQVRVTDTKGSSVTSDAWSITVATTRFKFIAPAGLGGSDSNTGAIDSPWLTLAKFQADGTIQTIGYFREGTYNVYDGPGVVIGNGSGSNLDSTRWGATQDRPIMFLAYPGENPIFDHGYVAGVTEGLMWDFGNSGSAVQHIYLDGGEHIHAHNKCIRVVPSFNSYCVFRKVWFHNNGPGADGSNSSLGIDFESGGYTSGDIDNCVCQDCEFSHYTNNAGPTCCFKLYATDKALIEDCYFHDLNIGGQDEEAIANKAGNRQLTVRGCWSGANMDQGSYGGNQNGGNANGYQCDAELAFNYFQCSGNRVVNMNHDNNSSDLTRMHRNTFRGTVRWVSMGGTTGPWILDRNVIVNGNAATDNPDGSGVTHVNAPTISRLTVQNHLFGADNGTVIDSNGLLVNRSLVGLYGHEVP